MPTTAWGIKDLVAVEPFAWVKTVSPYIFDLSKFNQFMASTALLLTGIILNKYWHWWRIQKII